ncbi:MFS transporter [Sediminicoccus sp. BL-A-41-H5]|uniref:MFS transporter n=1 Tax=Sediminicoccus sp. BL-A-41-H5 TaxID=3421106 RepID=UPI003D672021
MHIFLRVTLPLAFVNVLNQASRAMLAVIGPLLALEFSLSASDLGLLAAVLFVAYAGAQLPVGVALDRYGARRVQTVLAALSGAAFLLCALADGVVMLGIGRFLTGIGIAAGLMAMLKANTQWFPKARIAAMTGSGIFIGGLGGMMATLPLQAMLPLVGWRGGFAVLAVMSFAIAAWIWISVADAPPGHAKPPTRGLVSEVKAFGPIFTNPYFTRFVPAIIVLSGLNFVYQGLWAGPWLRDVAGFDAEARAIVLFAYACGMAGGSLGNGQAASFFQARGHSPMLVPCIAMGVQISLQALLIFHPPMSLWALCLVWFIFAFSGSAGPMGYAAVGQRFTAEFAGRVATAINGSMLVLVFILQYVIGAIIDFWPRTASGGWDAAGYAWAMGLTLALQAGTILWAWRLHAFRRGALA